MKGKLPKNITSIAGWNKGKKVIANQGVRHWNWKGGKQKTTNSGYILIYAPNRPGSKSNYEFEHRVVMESVLSRPLKKGEVVHHINGNTTDNRPENLELISNHIEHIKRYHHTRS